MRNTKLRNILIVLSLAFLIAMLITGANVTDRNFAPGSPWPHIWGGIAIASAVILFGLWVYFWFYSKK